VAVFPTTNFPPIIVGVDNGVMPIEQMEVAITRARAAVRAVPGLEDVRSVSSRGSAEINLFFNWNVDMLRDTPARRCGVSRVQSSLPSTAKIQNHTPRLLELSDHRLQLTSDTDGRRRISGSWPPIPRSSRGLRLPSGRQRPQSRAASGLNFTSLVDPPRSWLRAKTSVADIVNARENLPMSSTSPGLLSRNNQLFSP